MPKKGGTPAGTAAKKSESRHNQWWYPNRCERPGCEEEDPSKLQKCSGCRMVQYCCKEHQKEDWKAHKKECKLFQALDLRATFYSDSDMLARYPLAPHPRFSSNSEPAKIPRGSRCGLCLVPDSEESMTRTNCCGNILCDTSHRYQLMSYSREFCERSHDRYTLCGYHGMEEDCNTAVDWRECEKCSGRGRGPAGAGTADRLWRGLNAYNFCPLLSKDVPRHGLCDVCDKCKEKFVSGVEGCGFSAAGKIVCLLCSYQGIGE